MAKKSSTPVEETIKSLIELQTIDTKIDEIQILKGELPMEVSDLEDEIAGLETRTAKLSGNLDDINSDISNHKNNIKEAEAFILKYEKQLDDVKNNREFEALTKEIEMQKLEIQLSEKKMRAVDLQKDKKKETLDHSKENLDNKKKDLDIKKVELEKIKAKTEKEERKLTKASTGAKAGLSPRLLKSYDKIRNNYKNGLAVVTISRGSCGGCFNRIPPQLQIEIGQRKKLVACEHCGRVLVDNELAGKEEAK